MFACRRALCCGKRQGPRYRQLGHLTDNRHRGEQRNKPFPSPCIMQRRVQSVSGHPSRLPARPPESDAVKALAEASRSGPSVPLRAASGALFSNRSLHAGSRARRGRARRRSRARGRPSEISKGGASSPGARQRTPRPTAGVTTPEVLLAPLANRRRSTASFAQITGVLVHKYVDSK